jgi:hypothetical protein
MTVAQAQTLMRLLLGEKDTSDTYNSTNTMLLLNAATRLAWTKLANIAPQACSEDKYISFAAGELSKTLKGVGENDVLLVLSAYQLPNAGAIADANRPIKIRPAHLVDLESDSDGLYRSTDARLCYTYDGNNNLILRSGSGPVQSATYVLVRLIRQATTYTATSDNLLGGRFPHLHDLVVYGAVRIATEMMGERGNRFARREDELWNEAIPALRATLQEPPGIRTETEWD